jgi:hypothetical protein
MSQVELAVNPTLFTGLREISECLGVVLFDTFAVQVHDAQTSLANGIRLKQKNGTKLRF